MTLILSGTNGLSDVDGSAATPAIRGTDTNTGIFFPAADTVGISTGGSERARVDSSGNLGVGCTSLVGSGSISIKGGQSLQWQAAGASTVYGDIYTDTSNNMVFRNGSSPSERMRLDASGNLGVGTTSPTAYSGYKTLSLNGSNGGVLEFKLGDAQQARISNSGGALLQFVTNGTEAMRIDSSGNLLVGSTTVNVISSNVAGCTIWGGANAGEFMAAKAGASLELSRLSTTGGMAYFYYNSSNVAGYISVNSASTVGYNQGSDERLKKNIVDSNPALDHVLSMRVRAFDWKSDDLHWDYGFIAQELKQIAPYAVYTPENPDEMMGIDFSKLVPALTKAIQEQQAIITQLQADVAALKGNA